MTFFRVYVDDQPYEPEHYFLWSVDGASADDAVFVVGNPGSTSRLETVAQLELRRDVTDKNLLAFIDHFIVAMHDYQAGTTTEDGKNAVRNQLFSLLNAQKAYNGQLAALADPVIMARRRDAEQKFQQAIEAGRVTCYSIWRPHRSDGSRAGRIQNPGGAQCRIFCADIWGVLFRHAATRHAGTYLSGSQGSRC